MSDSSRDPVEDDFTTVRGYVEVADRKPRPKSVSCRSLTGLEIDGPELLVRDVALHDDQRVLAQKGQTPGAPGEDQVRQRARRTVGAHRLHREGRADVRARIDEKLARSEPRPDRSSTPSRATLAAPPSTGILNRCGSPSALPPRRPATGHPATRPALLARRVLRRAARAGSVGVHQVQLGPSSPLHREREAYRRARWLVRRRRAH